MDLQQIKVWKLGCNWGRGRKSFYEFIKQEEIVLGYYTKRYDIGDLVLITEGFTVYAIARVLDLPKPITTNENFEVQLTYYDIPFEESIIYAAAEWYVLPETQIFVYQLQQGIVQVRKREIFEKALNLWKSRDLKLANRIRFFTEPPSDKDVPCFYLVKDSWNDYGFKTSFNLYYFRTESERVSIGHVKILDKLNTSSILPKEFPSLKPNFCSLGQNLEYYRRLESEVSSSFKEVLGKLNDCAFDRRIHKEFENEEGFKTSLLRSSEAELVLLQGVDQEVPALTKRKYSFNFEYKISDAVAAHVVDFSFNANDNLPNRFFCIIGKNGTGKTKIISQLANKLTDISEDGEFGGERPAFSKIIAASFSYFDKFKFPKKEDINYEFIGVKFRDGIYNEKEISALIWNSYLKVSTNRKKRELWLSSIKGSLEPEYFNFDLEELNALSTRNDFLERVDEIFSSGQKIIFQFITRVISVIDYNSLILFDEPETHLHPNVVGKLIKGLNNILNTFNSFCILSTHSPIVLQEVPSFFVRVFDRIDNLPIISRPVIETFGENYSTLANAIFNVDQERELYKEILDKLALQKSYDEIDRIFEGRLSLNARLYLKMVNKK
jgi:predicted ATPase